MQFFDTKECEWADVRAYFDGGRVAKISSFKFGVQQEKEDLHAEGDEPHSIQSGRRSYTAEMGFFKSVLDTLNDVAMAAGGRDCLDLEFDVVITYRAKGSRDRVVRTCVGFQFTGFDEMMEEGAKSMKITMPGKFLRLVKS